MGSGVEVVGNREEVVGSGEEVVFVRSHAMKTA